MPELHVLLVADGRSPITLRWIESVRALNHRVTLVSTYPCPQPKGVESLYILPVAFAAAGGSQAGGAGGRSGKTGLRKAVGRFRGLLQPVRDLLGPLTLPFYARKLEKILTHEKPDLVHALRIPYEGMLAASARSKIPLAVSIWGNDLTLHGSRSVLLRSLIVRTLRRADGLAADVQRDIRMGRLWGFSAEKPALVVPGNGGIDLGEVQGSTLHITDTLARQLPAGVPLVVNPRGLRPGYVRTDVFFQAIPLVLQHRPDVIFVCTSMAGQPEAQDWVQRLKIGPAVRLLPYLPQAQLWNLFQNAEITVSISTHDGTPNTLLEAMACGCFPIVGDLESLREWITPGVNGLLVDPTQPHMVAEGILLALERPQLRAAAAQINLELVRQRAEVGTVRARIDAFYQSLLP